jgi:hypothetical protein
MSRDATYGMRARSTTGNLADDEAEDILFGDSAIDAAVGGVHAVVAHDEVLVTAAHNQLIAGVAIGEGWGSRAQIRFLQLHAVDEDVAILDVNRITCHADDAFDSKTMATDVADDDDITTLGRLEMINPAVKKVMIGIVEGGQHAGADNLDRGDEVMANDEVACRGHGQDAEALEDLFEKPLFARHAHHARRAWAGVLKGYGTGRYASVPHRKISVYHCRVRVAHEAEVTRGQKYLR